MAIFQPIRGAFVELGRGQKVIEDGVEHLGIPHWLVLYACLVLADKVFLPSTPDPSGRISISVDGFLTGMYYRFFLDDATTDYTICTNFSDWEPLLREDIPERWLMIDKFKTPSTSRKDVIRKNCSTGTCAMSPFLPLLPHTFYNPVLPFNFVKSRPINDIRQIITLESGLHDCMNRPSEIGLAEPYHLRAVNLPLRIEEYALFARFAWAITSIAQVIPTNEPKRKREIDRSGSPSGRPPPSHRHRGEGDSHVCEPGGHDENAKSNASLHDFSDGGLSSDHDSSDDAKQSVDVELLKEQERELTVSQLQIFRDAEEGTKPFPSYMCDEMDCYPGISCTGEMKRRYLADHLTISTTGESTVRRN
ncbi:hypothetical protein DFS33DRAFT_1485696 [Desarmillaria ectypa]|nr:hypothetical protein DFS33DRAFT_1485696 [Desarmillaria ectypa]